MDNKNCFNCRYFYDEWSDGTGKCERSHGGITHGSSGAQCRAFKEVEYEEDFDDEE